MVGHEPNLKDTGKYITANPFFRPAIDMTRKDVLKAVRDGVKALLERAAKGAGFK